MSSLKKSSGSHNDLATETEIEAPASAFSSSAFNSGEADPLLSSRDISDADHAEKAGALKEWVVTVLVVIGVCVALLRYLAVTRRLTVRWPR
jgi:hypothetical protein